VFVNPSGLLPLGSVSREPPPVLFEPDLAKHETSSWLQVFFVDPLEFFFVAFSLNAVARRVYQQTVALGFVVEQ
jgi:hypothetical protein